MKVPSGNHFQGFRAIEEREAYKWMMNSCRFRDQESDIPVPGDRNAADHSSLPPEFRRNSKPDRSHDHHFAQLCLSAPLLFDVDKKV